MERAEFPRIDERQNAQTVEAQSILISEGRKEGEREGGKEGEREREKRREGEKEGREILL